jgi:hypothetical protein
MIRVACIVFLFLVAQNAHASDSLFLYESGNRNYYEVDASRLMIKWRPFSGSINQTGFLDPYPGLQSAQIDPVKKDEYYLHSLSEGQNLDSLMSMLKSDSNVIAVNPGLCTTGFGYSGALAIHRLQSHSRASDGCHQDLGAQGVGVGSDSTRQSAILRPRASQCRSCAQFCSTGGLQCLGDNQHHRHNLP